MSNNIDLSPCPLCGGKPWLDGSATIARIYCNCGLTLALYSDGCKARAVERWEIRPRTAVSDHMDYCRKLLAATQQMVQNRDPRFTAEEAFDRVFYPALNTTKQELNTALTRFYSEVFPTLQSLTRPRPAAQDLVKAAFDYFDNLQP